MTAFQARLIQAHAHERAVSDRLLTCGWVPFEFGQSLLPDPCRNALKAVQTNVRWCPDIIAVHGAAMASIDAKYGRRWQDTGNHDVEKASADSLLAWSDYSGWPSYFVFADFMCASPQLVLERGRLGRWNGNGSGTPFLLIKISDCYPFDDVFGAPTSGGHPC